MFFLSIRLPSFLPFHLFIFLLYLFLLFWVFFPVYLLLFVPDNLLSLATSIQRLIFSICLSNIIDKHTYYGKHTHNIDKTTEEAGQTQNRQSNKCFVSVCITKNVITTSIHVYLIGTWEMARVCEHKFNNRPLYTSNSLRMRSCSCEDIILLHIDIYMRHRDPS